MIRKFKFYCFGRPFLKQRPEETIEVCTNELFKESETPEGLSKSELKELLFLATKNSHFIFDLTLYKQINGVALDPPFGLTLANALLVHGEKT